MTPFTLGALLMLAAATEPADGQEKDPELKAPYTQYVKFEAVEDGKVTYTRDRAAAYVVGKDNPKWAVKSYRPIAPRRGDKVTDKDGKVYSVTKAERTTQGVMYILTTDPAPVPPVKE